MTFDVEIVDECHYCKSKDAKRTKALFGPKCDGENGVVRGAAAVFLLSGTPMPNHPAELWPMLRAVMPGAILKSPTTFESYKLDDPLPLERLPEVRKPLPYWSFVDRYCKTVDNGFGVQIVGGKKLDELKSRIAPYVLRRKKDEVLPDLPPLRIDTLPLVGKINVPGEMNRQQFEMIQAFEQDGIEGLAKIAPHIAQLRRMTGMAKVAPVVEWVQEQLDAGLKKIVLFAHHREVLTQLAVSLKDAGVPSRTVAGDTPSAQRQSTVDLFQNDPSMPVFIGQIQAAGTGITLTAASDLVFVESSWVPAENEQAAMRIHRIGQKNACLVRFATIADSLDEQIAKACARKLETISQVFA